MNDKPIIAGKPATRLSEIVVLEDLGDGVHMWVINQTSAPIMDREDAYDIAHVWYPELIDDRDA